MNWLETVVEMSLGAVAFWTCTIRQWFGRVGKLAAVVRAFSIASA
jgi:hypothetical protein